MPYRFYDCNVTGIIDESDVVKRFIIKVPDQIPFEFKAGQFVMLDLPVDDKTVDRAYSIASPPLNNHTFELAVVIKPGGAGSTYLFNEVKEGTVIKVSKPLGKFRLPEPIHDDLCFICTGTGIAPLRSMTHHIFNHQLPHKKIYLIFGNRWIKDILYRKEMETLATQYPEFIFIPVLSRSNPGWSGRTGYVHAAYEELFADRRPAHFFVCGWHEMISEARQRIAAMGYDKTRIRFELYD